MLRDFGLGTEKLEEELNKLFKARIVRMDVDTTSKKGEHQKIIDDFGKHKYDILIGTQMIAKGLDFPLCYFSRSSISRFFTYGSGF